jgi:hypothetical protein
MVGSEFLARVDLPVGIDIKLLLHTRIRLAAMIETVDALSLPQRQQSVQDRPLQFQVHPSMPPAGVALVLVNGDRFAVEMTRQRVAPDRLARGDRLAARPDRAGLRSVQNWLIRSLLGREREVIYDRATVCADSTTVKA